MRKPCFKCCRKHLSQAEIKCNEMRLGYPEHYELCFEDMKNAEDKLWVAFDKWNECLGQMSEASDETVGMSEQFANKIREERVALESNPNYCPDFKGLIRASKILEEDLGSTCSSGKCEIASVKKSVARRGSINKS